MCSLLEIPKNTVSSYVVVGIHAVWLLILDM